MTWLTTLPSWESSLKLESLQLAGASDRKQPGGDQYQIALSLDLGV